MPQQKTLGSEWEDYNPQDWEDVSQPDNRSFLRRAWDTISEPIPAVKDWAKRTGDTLSQGAIEPGFMSTMKNFGAGALEGIGNLASPLNIAATAMGGGEFAAARAGLPAAARLLNIGGRVANIPQAMHGAGEILDPNTSIADKAMGAGELGLGALGMRGPSAPKIKPNINPKVAQGAVSDIDSMIGDLNLDPNMNMGIGDPELAGSVPYRNNGSGESAASLESLSRMDSMKSQGQQFVVYDSKGAKRPLIGPDAVDYQVRNGESYGIEGPNGFQLLDDKGGRYPQITPDTKAPIVGGEPSAIIIKKPSPEVIKQVMQKGYILDTADPIRGDGAFRMIKAPAGTKPPQLPVLEGELQGARPTPSRAAAMGSGRVLPPAPAARAIATPDSPKGTGVKPKEQSPILEAFNFPRAVMASMDFSAPLRQGLPLIHKKQFWTSLDDMFKAWGSEGAYKQIHDSILEKPMFRPRPGVKNNVSFAEEAGLRFTDLTSLSNREEAIMSSWAEKIPGVRRSNRAYTSFLNKLRADTFEDLITKSKVIGADGEANLPLARAIADFVNTASGRGSLGKLEKSATTLNTMLFSPRLIASRMKMLNPAYYIMAPPEVRKEALKSLFAIAAAGNTVGALGKMAGGTVESDPRNSDFGKVKIGNVRLDPYGGFQQYVVAASRLMTGKSISSSSGKEFDLTNPKGPYDQTMGDVVWNFARSKAHPTIGFAISLLNGAKEMTGQQMDFGNTNPFENAVGQRFIPILLQDLYSLREENPSLIPVLGPLTGFGMSTQVYGNQ